MKPYWGNRGDGPLIVILVLSVFISEAPFVKPYWGNRGDGPLVVQTRVQCVHLWGPLYGALLRQLGRWPISCSNSCSVCSFLRPSLRRLIEAMGEHYLNCPALTYTVAAVLRLEWSYILNLFRLCRF